MTTERIIDIVESLGLIDLVTSRLRRRLEDIDVDELFEEAGRYVRRNPEVLVVALATITVSSALIVYLNAKDDFDDDDDEERPAPARKSGPRAR